MTSIPEKFPKIQCPFVRNSETDSSKSYVTNKLKDQYSWVFDEGTQVVEKLHGTNIGVELEHGDVKSVAVRHGNREMNQLNPFGSTAHQYITRAVQNSVNDGFMYQFNNGWVFGEVVGPHFHGNPYDLEKHLFIPFDWIREHCHYEGFPKQNDLDDVRSWMNSMYSYFSGRINGMNPEEASIRNGFFAEGVVFINDDFNGRINPFDLTVRVNDNAVSVAQNVAKLRRDMFEDIDVNQEFPRVDI